MPQWIEEFWASPSAREHMLDKHGIALELGEGEGDATQGAERYVWD